MLEWEGNNRASGQAKYRDICTVTHDSGSNNLARAARSGLKRSLVDLKMNLVALNEVGVSISKVYVEEGIQRHRKECQNWFIICDQRAMF